MAPKRTLKLSDRAVELLDAQPHNQRGAIVSRAIEEQLAPSPQIDMIAWVASLEKRIAALEQLQQQG